MANVSRRDALRKLAIGGAAAATAPFWLWVICNPKVGEVTVKDALFETPPAVIVTVRSPSDDAATVTW